MNILFCGTNVLDKIECNSRSISAAGNRYQNNVISCLKEMGHTVCDLSYVRIPKEDGSASLSSEGRSCDNSVDIWEQSSYKVTMLTKRDIMARIRAVKDFHKQIRECVERADIVMSYNVHYAWLDLPTEARIQGKRSAVFLADYSGPECFRNPVRRIYAWEMKNAMRRYDVVIGLSKNIEKYLKPEQRFILLEGGIDKKVFDHFACDSDEPDKQAGGHVVSDGTNALTYMYSGLLSHVTGVDMLLDAMKVLSDRNIRLVITGKGDLEDEVKKAAEEDSRITYAGHLEYDDYLNRLKKADVLVNPRSMDLPENQNNFPSKIMDYLSSGKRIISTRFAGYEKFSECIDFTDSSVEGIADKIDKISEEAAKTDASQRCSADAERRRYNREFAKQFLWENELKNVIDEIM